MFLRWPTRRDFRIHLGKDKTVTTRFLKRIQKICVKTFGPPKMSLTRLLLPADLTIFYFPCTITAIKLLSIMLSIACSALQCRLKLPVSGMLLPRFSLKSNDFHLQRSHPPLSGSHPRWLRMVLLHEFLALDKHSVQHLFQGRTPGLAAKAPTAGRGDSAADCMLSSASGGIQRGDFSPHSTPSWSPSPCWNLAYVPISHRESQGPI